MKKSELIKQLIDELAKTGDMHILYYKISDSDMCQESSMLSPTRKNKNGYRAKMNLKEFNEYVKNNPIETEED